jgi:hypothetical protein
MRRLLLALPFALLPLAIAHAADEHDHDHEHGSLGAHEHGVGRLNAVLDGQTLELELESPAMNLVGFEHTATTDADKAKVAAVRAQLEKPLALFSCESRRLRGRVRNWKARCSATSRKPMTITTKTPTGRTSPRPQRNSRPLQFTCATPVP